MNPKGRQRSIVAATLFLGALFVEVICQACDVPVFRYALERWGTDPYPAYVFHRGPLSQAEQQSLAALRRSNSSNAAPVNVEIHSVDVDGPLPDAAQKIWQTQSNPTLPWLVLTFPDPAPHHGTAWSGPLAAENVRLLADSPARQEVARRILAGDSVVWVFLESGDATKDNAAATRLTEILSQVQQVIKVPDPVAGNSVTNAALSGTGTQTAPAQGLPPLTVRFSVLRVSRNDPAESQFIRLLLKTEDGLDASQEPMTFPIFGQGRVLYSIVGRGINGDNVGQACAFLAGACSCEVKAQNPGTDLLMAVDWQGRLGPDYVIDVPVGPLTSLSAAIEPPPTTNEITAVSTLDPSPEPSPSRWTVNLGYAIGSGVVLIVIASVVLVRRTRRGLSS